MEDTTSGPNDESRFEGLHEGGRISVIDPLFSKKDHIFLPGTCIASGS